MFSFQQKNIETQKRNREGEKAVKSIGVVPEKEQALDLLEKDTKSAL